MPTRTDYVYLAGLIDGEGHVGARLKPVTNRAPVVYMRVAIGMTHAGVIYWLKETFGGSVQVRRRQDPRWNDVYVWTVAQQEAADLLTHVERYLRVKRDHARIIIRLAKLLTGNRWTGIPNQPKRTELLTKLTELNVRGV